MCSNTPAIQFLAILDNWSLSFLSVKTFSFLRHTEKLKCPPFWTLLQGWQINEASIPFSIADSLTHCFNRKAASGPRTPTLGFKVTSNWPEPYSGCIESTKTSDECKRLLIRKKKFSNGLKIVAEYIGVPSNTGFLPLSDNTNSYSKADHNCRSNSVFNSANKRLQTYRVSIRLGAGVNDLLTSWQSIWPTWYSSEPDQGHRCRVSCWGTR